MGLDSVELVMAVEEEFGIQIADRDSEKLMTVGDFHRLILTELERSGRGHDSNLVFSKLREIICDQIGVKPQEVVPEARFIEDLGMD